MNSEQSTHHRLPIDRETWARFRRIVFNLLSSPEVGKNAQWMSGSLIVLLFVINGLYVVNSYVGRDFVTAIENRATREFVVQAALYIGMFGLSTVVAVFYRFIEESLGLLWRKWLTEHAVRRYLENRTYYRLDIAGEVANPDQRIAEDIRAFTVTTLSFVLMLLNATFTVIAFSGVLWSIRPMLFFVAVIYAAVGSFLTIALGKPLVKLNYDQLDKEANFRADLIHIRENSESVALLHRESRFEARLLGHLESLTDNFRRIIAVHRNLGFFTNGYNYLVQIIPALVVAPLFFADEIEFGVITQSAMAFTHLVGAFSLIVTQFQSISSFAAVIARLGLLGEAMERARSTQSVIEIRDAPDRVAYEKLTLRSPRDGRVLVEDLSVTIPTGTRVLIAGVDDRAKVALFRATAGIWDAGEGRIVRPALDRILFLPERPYVPPGTLRDVLVRTEREVMVPDEQIRATLTALGLDRVVERAGGLDSEKDWDDILSLGEQQLLVFARVFLTSPLFVFLDHPGTALSGGQVGPLLKRLSQQGITYLMLGDTEEALDPYDAMLQLTGAGAWQWKPLERE